MAGLTNFPRWEGGAFRRGRGFVAKSALQIQLGVALVGERFRLRFRGKNGEPDKNGRFQYLLLIHLAT